VGLSVQHIKVRDFRSYESFDLDLDPALTILVGPNASGKTNLIEAIELLTEADSFRKPAWADVVRQGSVGGAELALVASGDDRALEVDLKIGVTGRRVYRVNGKVRRSVNQVAGVLPCVVFTPEDLRLVKDSAGKRRGALDALGAQLSPTYAKLHTDYDKVLKQRNRLLREEADGGVLDVWTTRLIEIGASLVTHRMRLFARLEREMARIYPELAQDGPLRAGYVPSWQRDGVDLLTDDPARAMEGHLRTKQAAERSRRSSISGPHRDDMTFEIAGRDARVFASQGQQRTVALAWKLAEVAVTTDIAAQRPVLLLDDVMSELDETRRHALASFVGSVAQTVITTTNLGYFDQELLDRARVVSL
jgi:DNA replication and repair protein RecF